MINRIGETEIKPVHNDIRRIDPSRCAYNVGCLDGVDPADLGRVPVSKGRNHPLDKK
jgi:hypothetical protein